MPSRQASVRLTMNPFSLATTSVIVSGKSIGTLTQSTTHPHLWILRLDHDPRGTFEIPESEFSPSVRNRIATHPANWF